MNAELAQLAKAADPAIADAPAPCPQAVARIGPNAIIQLQRALEIEHSRATANALFAECGLLRYLEKPPDKMVDERHIIMLHRHCRRVLGAATFSGTARLAGSLTGDYLLANRIPRLARALLPRLPHRLASRFLLDAMAKHAWTFAGSGGFSHGWGADGLCLRIENSPLARRETSAGPVCDYYTATFERLFRALTGPDIEVREVSCIAAGDADCRFEVLRRQPARD